jgi:BirA family biotin operon repressor/biotin-[acetyl-CoA-carboxylase] ligase
MLWYDEVPSTNDLAARLADRGAPEGTVIAAHAQSAGRGRQGRTWVSPPGAGLYVSVVLRPPSDAVPLVTLAAGVAIAEGVEGATGLPLCVKWPNDLYAGERKVAGVLAEANSSGTVEYVVLGFGVNILAAAYPPEIAARATSLESELGRGVDRGVLLTECLCALADWYAELCAGRHDKLLRVWRARATATFGRRVRWEAAGASLDGVAENIDESGALLVRTKTGVSRVVSAEVSWL